MRQPTSRTTPSFSTLNKPTPETSVQSVVYCTTPFARDRQCTTNATNLNVSAFKRQVVRWITLWLQPDFLPTYLKVQNSSNGTTQQEYTLCQHYESAGLVHQIQSNCPCTTMLRKQLGGGYFGNRCPEHADTAPGSPDRATLLCTST